MRLQIAYITLRRELKSAAAQSLLQDYVQRASRLAPVTLDPHRSEAALLEAIARRSTRTSPHLVLLDSRGRALNSTQFAEHLRREQDIGTQDLVLAIGPPDGWSPDTRPRGNLILSLGPMTLPHELALVVLAEQVYRALAILAGHPYHSGHEAT